jgi:hypothetical protein
MNTKYDHLYLMSRFITLLLALSLASLAAGQTKSEPATPPPNEVPKPKSSRFSLDFPGGTPRELVGYIEKSMGRTINAIIPEEHADVRLPALRMQNVTLGALFQGLHEASLSRRAHALDGKVIYRDDQMGFRSASTHLEDDAVWFFVRSNFTEVTPRICRFYPLNEYLAGGLTVDDITTAIQTAWKMLGEGETPTLSFHKETKVLIAVGNQSKLDTINEALRSLEEYKLKARAAAAARPESKTKQ